jgi:hypothetical protein
VTSRSKLPKETTRSPAAASSPSFLKTCGRCWGQAGSEGENPELYEQLLARVGTALQPADIIDWLLVKDVVALSWAIQRSRSQRESLVRLGRRKAMEQVLEVVLMRSGTAPLIGEETEASRMASAWFNGDKKAEKKIDALFGKAGLTLADVATQALTTMATELDRLDRQNVQHEHHRDQMLQQIERRRAGWAKRVQRMSDEIIDADFHEAVPAGGGRRSINDLSAAAE